MYSLLCLGLFAAAVLAGPMQPSTGPKLPSQDPFYGTPPNISSYTPGQVIARRTITGGLSGGGVNSTVLTNLTTHQYSYRTTDSLRKAVAAVTSLYIPSNADPTKLLSYQVAYDSTSNDCSPSYALRVDSEALISDVAFIIAALERGWHVVSPDYQGLEAQYVANAMAGHATLDSLRAVLGEVRAGTVALDPHARTAVWGYSGGAGASEWAAELQPAYAPELALAGAALGGLTPNITNVFLSINAKPISGISFYGLAALARAYPAFAAFVDAELLPEKKAEFWDLSAGCVADAARGGNKDLFSYFRDGRGVLYKQEYQLLMAAAGQMGAHGTPTAPLFVYKVIKDEYSPIADSDALVSWFCGNGASVEYRRNYFGNHGAEAVTGAADAIEWLAARLRGDEIPNVGRCETRNVNITTFDLGVFGSLGPGLVASLQSLI